MPVIHARPVISGTMAGRPAIVVSSTIRPLKRVPSTDSLTNSSPTPSAPRACSCASRALVPVPHGERSSQPGWIDVAARAWIPPRARRIGLVPQDLALFPHLDVRANLLYGHPRSTAAGATAPDTAAPTSVPEPPAPTSPFSLDHVADDLVGLVGVEVAPPGQSEQPAGLVSDTFRVADGGLPADPEIGVRVDVERGRQSPAGARAQEPEQLG